MKNVAEHLHCVSDYGRTGKATIELHVAVAKLEEEEKRGEAGKQEAAASAEKRDATIKRLRAENTTHQRAQVRAESQVSSAPLIQPSSSPQLTQARANATSQAADAAERATAAEDKAAFESAAAAAVKEERDAWVARAEDAQRSASASRKAENAAALRAELAEAELARPPTLRRRAS